MDEKNFHRWFVTSLTTTASLKTCTGERKARRIAATNGTGQCHTLASLPHYHAIFVPTHSSAMTTGIGAVVPLTTLCSTVFLCKHAGSAGGDPLVLTITPSPCLLSQPGSAPYIWKVSHTLRLKGNCLFSPSLMCTKLFPYFLISNAEKFSTPFWKMHFNNVY